MRLFYSLSLRLGVSLLLWVFISPPAQAQETKRKKIGGFIDANTEVLHDIEYAIHDGVSLKLDLYLPKDRDASQPLPVVIWVHGGGWLNGSKANCKATWLVPEGFAVASIGYRLTDVAQWPGQIEDCYAAVRWLRKNAAEHHLDPDHIAAWGGSAGGHLAALMGTRPNPEKEDISSRVQAVCDWYGPSDLLSMPPNNVSKKRSLEKVANSNGAKLLGATVRDVPEKAKDASALYQASEDDPPFLIMHGSEDPGVPLEQNTRLHDALKAADVSSRLHIVQGAGHGGKEFQTDEVRGIVLQFFNQSLKGS